MRLALDLIQPSPTPVRTTWDEDKMNELAQSIREQGVIVPVKVRKTEWTYELIYGHRRVEAARRAGLDEIDAIVEDTSDDDALTQALVENVQREDMTPADTARALKALQDRTAWSITEIGRRGIMPSRSAGRYLAILAEEPATQALIGRGNGSDGAPHGKVSIIHIDAAREAGLDAPARREVIEKSATEGLNASQTRRVADAVAAAPSPEAKRRLLDMEYSPIIHDADMVKERAARYGAHDPFYQDTTPTKQQQYDQSPEVKATVEGVIDAAKRWNELIKVIRGMTEVGKLAPESRQFIAHRARLLAKTLTDWANELETKE